MPNLKKSIEKLAEYEKALEQLKGGNDIIVDGVELAHSMNAKDKDSDLSSVERMICRLKMQVERAKEQEIGKGAIIQGDDGETRVGFARGVPSLASDLGLESGDLPNIVPTGSNGVISKRDVRVYSRYKADGNLDKYFERSGRRRTGESIAAEPVKKPAAVKPEKPIDKLIEKVKKAGRKKATKAETSPKPATDKPVNPLA